MPLSEGIARWSVRKIASKVSVKEKMSKSNMEKPLNKMVITQEMWQRWTQWPMAFAAVVFLAIYSIQVIADTTQAQAYILNVCIGILWAIFLLDYVFNLVTAKNRRTWFLRNLHELAILVLPFLKPLRLLRLITLVRAINRVAGTALRGKIVFYVLGSAVLLVYTGALAVLDAEKSSTEANITTIGDALWWAVTTITTVGYGDHYPVTGIGRMVAVGLMIGGVAVLSVVTATVASWMVEAVAAEVSVETNQDGTNDLKELSLQIQDLKSHIMMLTQKNKDEEDGL